MNRFRLHLIDPIFGDWTATNYTVQVEGGMTDADVDKALLAVFPTLNFANISTGGDDSSVYIEFDGQLVAEFRRER